MLTFVSLVLQLFCHKLLYKLKCYLIMSVNHKKILEVILRRTWISLPNFPSYKRVVQTFNTKPQMWTSWWHKGKVRGSLKSLGFILWEPWMCVPNFVSSSGCWDISLDKRNFAVGNGNTQLIRALLPALALCINYEVQYQPIWMKLRFTSPHF